MLARIDTGRKKGGEESAGRFLNELETYGRALYPDKPFLRASIAGAGSALRSTTRTTPTKGKVKPSGGGGGVEDLSQKKSIWNWKPLKALSITRNKKFRCCFSLQVHSVEGLPYRFENKSICVHWKKRDGELVTRPSKVKSRFAEFDEILTHECIVHGSRSGPHNPAKYDAKHFMLFLSVVGAKDLDLGKHRIDLTRLLPLTLEELEDEKSSGNWTTAYKLSGDAKGGTINVSFAYTVANDSPVPSGSRRVGDDKGITQHSYLRSARPLPKYSPGDVKDRVRRRMLEPSTSVERPDDLNWMSSNFNSNDASYPSKVVPSSESEHRKSLSEMLSTLSVELRKDLNEVGSTSAMEHESVPNQGMSTFRLEHESDLLPLTFASSLRHENVSTEVIRNSSFERDRDLSNVMLPSDYDDKDGTSELMSISNLEEDDGAIEVISVSSVEREIDPNELISATSLEHELISSSMYQPAGQADVLEADVHEETSISVIDFKLECDNLDYQADPGELCTHIASEPELDEIEESCLDGDASISGLDFLTHPDSELNTTKDYDDSTLLCHYQVYEHDVDNIAGYHADNKRSITDELITDEVPTFSVDNFECSEMADSIQHLEERDCEIKLHSFDTHDERLFWKESVMEELDKALEDVSKLEAEAVDSPKDIEDEEEEESLTGGEKPRETLSLFCEDDIDTVANDFLDMLGFEESPLDTCFRADPESPRESLLRQFEQDSTFSLFDFDDIKVSHEYCDHEDTTFNDQANSSDELDLELILKAVEEEHEMEANPAPPRLSARTLEDMESEALMREWGLNDNAFQSPPPSHPVSDSPSVSYSEEPEDLPPLGEGIGSFMQTKDGGFLRSMSPHNFKNSKSGGSLIMQVSSPVVVPAEMGSDVMDILQGLASIGVEKLSMQANKLMPLEDITGKTMQQVGWEAGALDTFGNQCLSQGNIENTNTETLASKRSCRKSSAISPKRLSSEYVSLEEIAPMAMDKIETLSLEGLKIQSGMSNEEGTSEINAKSIGELSALRGKDMEGTAGLQLMGTNQSADEVDGLMGLSLTLDEWMRLDSGDLGDEDNISERTSKILEAHHANTLDTIRGSSKGERRRARGSGRKGGLLGDNFTVALLVQLRDPLRNYEPVGTPMLALVQVERVFAPPKPKIYYNVSGAKTKDDDEDEEPDHKPKEGTGNMQDLPVEAIPQFQIQEVHIAGLKADPSVKKPWGTATQQQSGSRWLLANGMGKSGKQPAPMAPTLLKSKAGSNTTAPMAAKPQPKDSLWSISSRVHAGKVTNWKQPGKLNPHVRNPNVLLPSNSMKRK